MSKSFRGKIKNKANSKKTNLQLLEEALNHYGPDIKKELLRYEKTFSIKNKNGEDVHTLAYYLITLSDDKEFAQEIINIMNTKHSIILYNEETAWIVIDEHNYNKPAPYLGFMLSSNNARYYVENAATIFKLDQRNLLTFERIEPSHSNEESTVLSKSNQPNDDLTNLSEFLACYTDESFKERIMHIERDFKIIGQSNEKIHTLPYYIANSGLPVELRAEALKLLKLMKNNNSIIISDEKNAINCLYDLHSYPKLRELLSIPDSSYYIKGIVNYDLQKDREACSMLRVANSNQSVLDVLGYKTEKNNEKDKTDYIDSLKKHDAFLETKALLKEYFEIIECEDIVRGQRLIECICGILNNLRLFPEYIDKETIDELFHAIPISDKDYEKYLDLVRQYNDIDKQINEYRDDSRKNIATAMVLREEMAILISPVIKNGNMFDIFSNLNNYYFGKDINVITLLSDERFTINQKIIDHEEDLDYRYKLDKIKDYAIHQKPFKKSEGKVGAKEFVLIIFPANNLDHFDSVEIHTLDSVHLLRVTNDAKHLTYTRVNNSKNRDKSIITVKMPLDDSAEERVIFEKPNGDKETFYPSEINDYVVKKENNDCSTRRHYYSKHHILTGEHHYVSTIKKKTADGLGRFLPAKPINPEINILTQRAIMFNIKGVIPREVLELYRKVMPKNAALIDNYGVSVPKEEEYVIPKVKDKQNDAIVQSTHDDVDDQEI